MMKHLMTVFIASVLLSVSGIGIAGDADEQHASLDTGLVLIYRPHDQRSQRVLVNIAVESDHKRLASNNYVQFQLIQGEHTLSSNLRGSKALAIRVSAGQTSFVRAKMERRGGLYKTVLESVSNEVAVNELPKLRLESDTSGEEGFAVASPR